MQGKLARPVWGWGPGAIPGPTPLFAGHDEAAENHARLWSLIASAERHGVDPQRYLTSVLAKLPLLRPHSSNARDDASTDAATAELEPFRSSELAQFLPDTWRQADAAEPQPARAE